MKMADTACMGLVVAQIIGRWGDFLTGNPFGEYTDCLAMQPLSFFQYEAARSVHVGKIFRL